LLIWLQLPVLCILTKNCALQTIVSFDFYFPIGNCVADPCQIKSNGLAFTNYC
jgi:hypothetical protein